MGVVLPLYRRFETAEHSENSLIGLEIIADPTFGTGGDRCRSKA
jgi:hypothetical protein